MGSYIFHKVNPEFHASTVPTNEVFFAAGQWTSPPERSEENAPFAWLAPRLQIGRGKGAKRQKIQGKGGQPTNRSAQ
jgi:hypothetical protein